MLVAIAIDADRRHKDMIADMKPVDLNDQQIEFREVGGKPFPHFLARQRHEALGNGRLSPDYSRGGVKGSVSVD